MENNIIPAAFTFPVFNQIRYQYNLLVRQMFQYNRYMPPQITYEVPKTEKYFRSKSVDASFAANNLDSLANVKNTNSFLNNFLFSRYQTEYVELGHLGSGGFGSVFKV